jgi:hypothetical protein
LAKIGKSQPEQHPPSVVGQGARANVLEDFLQARQAPTYFEYGPPRPLTPHRQ